METFPQGSAMQRPGTLTTQITCKGKKKKAWQVLIPSLNFAWSSGVTYWNNAHELLTPTANGRFLLMWFYLNVSSQILPKQQECPRTSLPRKKLPTARNFPVFWMKVPACTDTRAYVGFVFCCQSRCEGPEVSAEMFAARFVRRVLLRARATW